MGPWYCHSAHSLPRTVSAAKAVGNREGARSSRRRGGLSAPALRVRAGRSAGCLQATPRFWSPSPSSHLTRKKERRLDGANSGGQWVRAVREPGERFWTLPLAIRTHLDKSLIFSNQTVSDSKDPRLLRGNVQPGLVSLRFELAFYTGAVFWAVQSVFV